MSCNMPLPAYQEYEGASPRIGYRIDQAVSGSMQLPNGYKLELPCGHCTGCLMDRRRSWSVRCMHEAQLYDSNLFLTLDYAPDHLPSSLSLEYRDIQLWLKRLRKDLRGVSKGPNGKYPIRFFLSGEYGPRTGRPHWHTILFNVDFADKVQLMNGSFRSSQAEKLWGKGNVVIQGVGPESISYVAGYTTYKMYGRGAHDSYEDVVNLATGEITARRPELVSMSRRPGIGHWWYELYGRDLFGGEEAPHDFAVMEGKKYKVPQYYWRKLQVDGSPEMVEELRNARIERSHVCDVRESSVERRSVREEALIRRVRAFSPRSQL